MIASKESNNKGSKTVIILDDNEVIRAVLKRLLEAQGFSVRTFACAAEFLEDTCAQLAPCSQACADVLLSDLAMPGKTGIELIQEIRENCCLIDKMGLISGCWTEDMRERADSLELPAFDKPADLDRLLSWMNV
ncbi:MAG: response regulator [Kiritimatiellia bacterium]|jgi:CheY-like chemotaxis protein|nr:response regulator [Kiritimatiellia bacterium]